MGVVSNNWLDCVLTLNYLHVQTFMLTDVQTPFLGTPFSSPYKYVKSRLHAHEGDRDQHRHADAGLPGSVMWSIRIMWERDNCPGPEVPTHYTLD